VDTWTLVAAVTAAVGALGAAAAAGFGSRAAFVQARASKEAADKASDAAKDAARIAGDALRETTRLAADLAQGGELKRWQRDELKALVVRFLTASHSHRQSAERMFNGIVPITRENIDGAFRELRDLELLRMQLSLVDGAEVDTTADALYHQHIQAALAYSHEPPVRQPSSDQLIDAIIDGEFQLGKAARAELGAHAVVAAPEHSKIPVPPVLKPASPPTDDAG